MKTRNLFSVLLTLLLLVIFSSSVQAQWATIARKVKSMRAGKTDISTVIIEAGTARVYQTVVDTLRGNSKFKIISQDPAKHHVEFSNSSYSVSLQVDSLEARLSQITVVAGNSGNSGQQSSSVSTDAIISVCNKIGVKCTVEK